MADDIVVFKGSKDGLHLIIHDGCGLKDLQDHIHKKITSAQSFFQGIKKIKYKGTSLSKEDLDTLAHWFMECFQIELEAGNTQDPSQNAGPDEGMFHRTIEEGLTKFVHNTIRSGRKLQYNGNLVIIGDVNPGAEVIAAGNIIVMGALRGIAHAGALGNKDANVVAFSLQPTQLRIADIISRSPDNMDFIPTCPEKASISGDAIVILPYYKNI